MRAVTERMAVALAAVLMAACGDGGAGTLDGRYLGDNVSFRLGGGSAYEFRLTGIECRVPHPDHPQLALCLVRAPGLPTGTLAAPRGAFSGKLGDVHLEGRVTGSTAEGTWRFEATCPSGDVCQAEGAWTAVHKPETVFDVPADPGGPDVAPVDTVADQGPVGGTDAQERARERLDAIRASVGVAPAVWDDAVAAAAQAHADYFTRHADAYQESGLSPHAEDPEWTEGFTGVSMVDRMKHAGVQGIGGASEVMAFTGTADGAMDGWMDTLYHREPLVHPSVVRWGFGASASGSARAEVADLVFGSAAEDGPARWPLPDATGVATSWNGAESPQPPLPAGESYPSGPIVTITWPAGTSLALTSARLVGPDGAEIPSQVRSTADDPHLMDSWALYSYDPLTTGTRYTVVFEGEVAGSALTETWSFTTR